MMSALFKHVHGHLQQKHWATPFCHRMAIHFLYVFSMLLFFELKRSTGRVNKGSLSARVEKNTTPAIQEPIRHEE